MWKAPLKAILLLLAASSCAGRPVMPAWDGKVYEAEPSQQAIVRKQSAEVIMCNSPEFDDFMCMTRADWKKLLRKYDRSCEKWKDNKWEPGTSKEDQTKR